MRTFTFVYKEKADDEQSLQWSVPAFSKFSAENQFREEHPDAIVMEIILE